MQLVKPPTAPAHSLAVGSTIHSKYGSLGFVGQKMIPSLDRTLVMLFSFPGCGKSFLTQSIPNVFVLNFDLAGIYGANPTCTVFPGIDDEKSVIDETGERIRFGIDHFLAKKRILLEMAADDYAGRPRCIVIDTMDSFFRLAMDYVPQAMGKPTFEDCGQAGWSKLYEVIRSSVFDLRAAGYGVWLLGHLTKIEVRDAKGKVIGFKVTTKSTANFYSDFLSVASMVGVMQTEMQSRSVKIQQPMTVGGKTTTISKTETQEKMVYFFVSNDPELPEFLKTRSPSSSGRKLLMKVELPETEPYAHLDSVYRRAMSASAPDPA